MAQSVINLSQISVEIKIPLLYQISFLYIRNQVKKKIITLYQLIGIKSSLILLIQIAVKILEIMNPCRIINKI